MEIRQYQAVVRSLKGKRVVLEIPREGLPAAFRSRSILPRDSASKVLCELNSNGRAFTAGDKLVVYLEEKRNFALALVLSSGIPMIVFALFFLLFRSLVESVPLAVAGAAFFLFPYYSFLWLLREHWMTTFRFCIK